MNPSIPQETAEEGNPNACGGEAVQSAAAGPGRPGPGSPYQPLSLESASGQDTMSGRKDTRDTMTFCSPND